MAINLRLLCLGFFILLAVGPNLAGELLETLHHFEPLKHPDPNPSCFNISRYLFNVCMLVVYT